MGKHRSRPYNPLIANTFFRAGFIEAWGRGIEKIKESCREAGNPMPEYTIKREDIMVMFQSLVSNTDQGTNQANQGTDYSVEARILTVIQKEPRLSQKKIANAIGEKYSTVKYYMESMKKSGIINREGSSQKGRWINFLVKKDFSFPYTFLIISHYPYSCNQLRRKCAAV